MHGLIQVEKNPETNHYFDKLNKSPVQKTIHLTQSKHYQHSYKTENIKMNTENAVVHIVIIFPADIK